MVRARHDEHVILAIAQLAEHLTVDICSNQMVPGSIPGRQVFCSWSAYRRRSHSVLWQDVHMLRSVCIHPSAIDVYLSRLYHNLYVFIFKKRDRERERERELARPVLRSAVRAPGPADRIYMYIYISYICISIYINIFKNWNTYRNTHVCTYLLKWMCVHMCIHEHMCTYTYVCR